jgi:DNA primase
MAGKIPQHFIDELLARVDIVDVIDARVTLKKAGSNHMACCPFHNEKTPSFSVSQPKQFFHCFGCGASGSAIGFLMDYENMHFVDAVEMLAESIGMSVPRDEQAARRHDDSKPLYAVMEEVNNVYRRALRDAPEAIDYLKRRGLDGDIAKRFGIGWTPSDRDALQKQFPSSIDALIKCGILTTGSDGTRAPYPRFRERVMFPIRDRRGRTIGFGGRVLDNSEPKYLNSPETPIFHKGSEVYGLFEARRAAQDANFVIVVEGYMDVVALAQAGIDNAVATLGTAANRQHSEMLFRTVPNIVFCFDGDRAGKQAAWRALQASLPLLEDGRDAHFLFLPDGEDPDSYVKEHGKTGFDELLNTRIPIIDQLYAHLAADVDMNSVGGKAQLAERAKPLVNTIPRGVYKQLALQRLESLIGLSLGSARAGAPAKPVTRTAGGGGLTPMSRAVLLVLQFPDIVASQPAEAYEFDENLAGANVLMKLVGLCEAEPGMTTARLLERFRGTSDEPAVNNLAQRRWWPDGRELDSDTAEEEFAHCMSRLAEQSRPDPAAGVDAQARTGLLAVRRRR